MRTRWLSSVMGATSPATMPEIGPLDEPDELRDDMACLECGAAAGVPCGPRCECDFCLNQIEIPQPVTVTK